MRTGINQDRDNGGSALERIVLKSEGQFEGVLKKRGYGGFRIVHYGAKEIDPRHLVVKICVRTDRERDEINANGPMLEEFRKILLGSGYPAGVIRLIFISAESEETVNRESKGNWWHHWK